ncbi:MBL fold metallo-hydrolase [Robinsoniella sp.]|uniref:MBL fold metallo-hydrolase n=1 Tax=Robinsoniella sp. TaxID=2496533 RepID=UPI0037532E5D
MQIKWLGQAGYELKEGNCTILLDPYFSDLVEKEEGLKRLVPAPAACKDVKADVILYTHDHIDHLDSDLVRAMDKGSTIFAGPGSGYEILKACGVPENNIRCMKRGDHFQHGVFDLEAVFAEHTPDSQGSVLHYHGREYYFTGDSLLTPEVGYYADKELIKADVIFVCINGKLGNMSVEEAITLTKRVQAETGVPNHYGMFAENTEDPQKYINGMKDSSCRTVVMEKGRAYNLEKL